MAARRDLSESDDRRRPAKNQTSETGRQSRLGLGASRSLGRSFIAW